MTAKVALTRTHRILIGVVVVGAVIIAGIGFAGSYTAVQKLAHDKGFGNFAYVFPVGIDAGICVLLALDLLLTWIRIPFPLLRQTAWLLTAATIAFNGAAAWPDPLGVGMHAVIPILFVVSVEAARHAIGRIADITADKHMEGVRITRWLLSPLPTFLLWRRMKLWELRSYEQVIKLEQERLVYQARLRSRFGRGWRRKAPVEAVMPLRLARYGVPLKETAPAGLAAANIEAPELFLSETPRELPPVQEERPEFALERVATNVAPSVPQEAVQAPEHPVQDEQLEFSPPTPQEAAQAPDSPVDRATEPGQEEITEQYLYDVFVQYGNAYSSDTSLVFPNWPELVEASASWYGVVVPEDTVPADLDAFARWYQARLMGRPEEPVASVAEQLETDQQPVQSMPVVEEPVVQALEQLEPAAPARSDAPKRVQAKVEDRQPTRAGRRGSTREQVADIYRNLSEDAQQLRGRPLATAIVEASGNALKQDTVRRSHISEELLAEYLQAGAQVPGPREETVSEEVR
ncbi:DUF2637 domain-containing protein [Streptomyces sp. NPDC058287]|uniref:DUF2637 domain-containing protein n=1 Tax=Streptomyces sp. NPDC058287 TaxID=3346423 RepID=UPI0036E74091